jgi:predicted RND superfamily exporter protein
MLLGALTAGGTFLVLMLTDFRGIQELGFIAGISILLAWLGTMTFLPALLVLVDRHHAARPWNDRPHDHLLRHVHVPALDRLASYPKTILAAAAVATLLSGWALTRVGFDGNVLNLQARDVESVAWEKRILATTGRSGFNALSSAATLDELRQKQRAFEGLPSVSEVDSVLRVIPDDQPEKIAVITSFAPLVAPVRIGRASALDIERLTRALADIKRRLDLAAAEAGTDLPAELRAVRRNTDAVLGSLRRVDRGAAESALNYLQAQLNRDFREQFHGLQRNLHPTPLTIGDLPPELRRRFVGDSGRFLLRVHPRGDTWGKEGAARFVHELRSVDPDVTGAPVITYEATRLMERAYLQGTAYAFILVACLGVLVIGRMRDSALALLPLVLGVLWTIGLMQVFGIQFNLANIWALPLIIGTSAEFGLNVMLRHLEARRQRGPLVARSTVMAVLLNGMVMMVGFGSLMVAAHRGIWSLGLLLTIGSACNLVAALVVLPVILKLVSTARPRGAEVPDLSAA